MIEKLSEKITFQKDSVSVDQYGNHKKAWTDYFSCHAYANTYVREEKDGVITTDERSIVFEVRYCSELAQVTSTSFRIIFHDEIYDIESVDMMNWNRKMIHFSCRKEARS